jgi:hypothetical protein
VKGDVHDIGKNIVAVVLGCNNFKVRHWAGRTQAGWDTEAYRSESDCTVRCGNLVGGGRLERAKPVSLSAILCGATAGKPDQPRRSSREDASGRLGEEKEYPKEDKHGGCGLLLTLTGRRRTRTPTGSKALKRGLETECRSP